MAKKQQQKNKQKSNDIPKLLVGCGRIGMAILSGWIKAGVTPSSIRVIETNEEVRKIISRDFKVLAFEKPANLDSHFKPGVVLFAVKPQAIGKILKSYKGFNDTKTLFISVVAGKSLRFFENTLGTSAPIIRAMPNLPVIIGRGITGAVINPNVTESHIAIAEKLFLEVGQIMGVAEEEMMDAITAISGSGPAYVFSFLDALTEAGISLGLEETDAEDLAKLTLLGSTELAVLSDKTPAELKAEVTSPGGTTEAALKILESKGKGLKELIAKTVKAAAAKSKELGD